MSKVQRESGTLAVSDLRQSSWTVCPQRLEPILALEEVRHNRFLGIVCLLQCRGFPEVDTACVQLFSRPVPQISLCLLLMSLLLYCG